MKIRIEHSESDEIVIKCREENDKIRMLKASIEELLHGESVISLALENTEHFIPKHDILFFESSNGKVYAHTCDAVYTSRCKLFELEKMMPPSFVRISKGAIVNVNRVSTLRRELVGNGELSFRGGNKKVYFSRAYYKLLQYKINEMRFENQ